MITIPAPIEGADCHDCHCHFKGWMAAAVGDAAYTICLECFTEYFWVYGVPAVWVKEYS